MAHSYYLYPTKNYKYRFGAKQWITKTESKTETVTDDDGYMHDVSYDVYTYSRTSYDCSYFFSDDDLNILKNKINNNLCSNVYLYLNCSSANSNSLSSKYNTVYFKGSTGSSVDVAGSTLSGTFDGSSIATSGSYSNADEYTYNVRIKLNLSYIKANLNNCKNGFTILNSLSNISSTTTTTKPSVYTNVTTIRSDFSTSDICLCVETTETSTTYNYTVQYVDPEGNTLPNSTYSYSVVTTTPSVYPSISRTIRTNKFDDIILAGNVNKKVHVGWTYTNSSGVTKSVEIGGSITLNRATETLTAIWNTVSIAGNNVPFFKGSTVVNAQSYLFNTTTYKNALPYFSDGKKFYNVMSVSSSNST